MNGDVQMCGTGKKLVMLNLWIDSTTMLWSSKLGLKPLFCSWHLDQIYDMPCAI
jgi:hypothetical protein